MTETATLSHPSTAQRSPVQSDCRSVRSAGASVPNPRRGARRRAADATIDAINATLLRHKVIFFRDQSHLDDAEQEAFAARFGDTVAHPTVASVRRGSRLLELDSSTARARTRGTPTSPSSTRIRRSRSCAAS